ncbi:hypothetical protein IV417_02855 [Alphaproteobacteria bacterium KMM 3653]|uniref:Uncharacterized protein n=1 Tax=Harenicola maris TaxID=2841044 RepID=A0AAP2CMJ8_9RHOB|nr:hypothetical protein [Harenicola maris]
MSNAETVAEWMENMPHNGIYNEAQDFRKAVIAAYGDERASWDNLTPNMLSEAVESWLGAKRLGPAIPALEADELSKAGAAVREWLSQHEDQVNTPKLLTVDQFQGALHAVHCSLRGLDMWAEVKERQAKAAQGGLNSNFNLRG